MKETLKFFRLRTRKYCINVGVPRRVNATRTFTTCSTTLQGNTIASDVTKPAARVDCTSTIRITWYRNYNYWCSECARGFAVKSHYENHVAKHEGRTFPCDLCEKRFKAKSSLQTHYKEQHGQNVSRTMSVWNWS